MSQIKFEIDSKTPFACTLLLKPISIFCPECKKETLQISEDGSVFCENCQKSLLVKDLDQQGQRTLARLYLQDFLEQSDRIRATKSLIQAGEILVLLYQEHKNPNDLEVLAFLLHWLAKSLMEEKEFEDSLFYQLQAIEAIEEAVKIKKDKDYLFLLADCLCDLAIAESSLHQNKEAIDSLSQALDLMESLYAKSSGKIRKYFGHVLEGLLLFQAKLLDQRAEKNAAAKSYNRLYDLIEMEQREQKGSYLWHPALLEAALDLAGLKAAQNKKEQAVKILELAAAQTIAQMEKKPEMEPLLKALERLLTCISFYENQGLEKQALKLCARTEALIEKSRSKMDLARQQQRALEEKELDIDIARIRLYSRLYQSMNLKEQALLMEEKLARKIKIDPLPRWLYYYCTSCSFAGYYARLEGNSSAWKEFVDKEQKAFATLQKAQKERSTFSSFDLSHLQLTLLQDEIILLQSENRKEEAFEKSEQMRSILESMDQTRLSREEQISFYSLMSSLAGQNGKKDLAEKLLKHIRTV